MDEVTEVCCSKMVRKSLTIDQKVSIINEIESGVKQTDVCKSRSLTRSTVSTIMKNKNKILHSHGDFKKNKRIRKPVQKIVDEALLRWLKYERSRNTPISGPILQAKAEEFAKLFKVNGFFCDSGWWQRFKKQYYIRTRKIYEQAATVDVNNATYSLKGISIPSSYTSTSFKDLYDADIKIEVEDNDLTPKTADNQVNDEVNAQNSNKVVFGKVEESIRQAGARHPIQIFFDSMARTVMEFPPPLVVKAKMEVLQVISNLELEMWNGNIGEEALKPTKNQYKMGIQNDQNV